MSRGGQAARGAERGLEWKVTLVQGKGKRFEQSALQWAQMHRTILPTPAAAIGTAAYLKAIGIRLTKKAIIKREAFKHEVA